MSSVPPGTNFLRTAPPPPSMAPSSYTIYRDHKYYGLAKRVFHYSLVLIRFYVTEPAGRRLQQVQNYVLELCGLVLLLLVLPLICVSAFCVNASRRARVWAIRRFYPQLEVCDDFSCAGDEGASIMSAVVWVDGRVTAQKLQKKYKDSAGTAILEKCIATKFGIHATRNPGPEAPFSVARHIVEERGIPAMVHNPLALDLDDHSLHGPKVRLQKLIGDALSKKLESRECPPWEITLIPVQIPMQHHSHSLQQLQQLPRVKTCCVLRFHRLLLQDSGVAQFLDGIFDQIQRPHAEDPRTILLDEFKMFWRWCQWVAPLKLSRLVLIKAQFPLITLQELRVLGQRIQRILSTSLMLLRSLCSIPVDLLQNAVCAFIHERGTRQPQRVLGLVPNHEIACSWSSTIDVQLLNQIQEKTGGFSTPESVTLCALAMGLNQYYVDTGLRNPGTMRVAVYSSNSGVGFKSVTIRTRTSSRSSYGSQDKYVLWSNLLPNSCPEWKIYGSEYLHDYAPRILPRSFAGAILSRIHQRHPIQLSIIDGVKPKFMWGHVIEEISFCSSSRSPISVCLVKCGAEKERIRLVVQSPMKILATSLTRNLSEYLREIGELVGVERDRIRIAYHKRVSIS